MIRSCELPQWDFRPSKTPQSDEPYITHFLFFSCNDRDTMIRRHTVRSRQVPC